MDEALQRWRKAGHHLPDILKDFHSAKEVFTTMHEMLGPQDPKDLIRQPSVVEGQVYVIDCFLWFMARHGYTLQRSRASQNFDSLEEHVQFYSERHQNAFAAMLHQAAVQPLKTSQPQTSLSYGAVQWLAGSDRFAASNTLFTRLTGVDAMGGQPMRAPHDRRSFRSCCLLLEMAPELKTKLGEMRQVSADWARLVDRWEELFEMLKAEAPDWQSEDWHRESHGKPSQLSKAIRS